MTSFDALSSSHFNESAPDDVETNPQIRFITNGLIAGIFITAGILANILVITKWLLDRGRWLPLYYYFLAFASWNLALLVSTLFFYSLPALLKQPADQSTIASVPYFYVIGYAGANCCLTAVVWLMVVLTLERYVAVVLPFHTRVSSPCKRAKIISTVLSATAILYNIPLMFELTIVQSLDSDHVQNPARTYWAVDTAPFRGNFYYQTIYRVVFNLLFISLIPFLTICLLTIKIVFFVRRANVRRSIYRRTNNFPPDSSSNLRTTSPNFNHAASNAATYGNILLTLFVIKFLICYTVPFALNVSELLLPAEAFQTAALKWITDASDFLVIIDSVSNAFLYSTWRNRIRFHKRKIKMSSLISFNEDRSNASLLERQFKERQERRYQTLEPNH